MNYPDFQSMPSSEKIVLATLDASKRLMGWEVHSGSVYKLENISFPVVVAIEDSGTAYTEAADAGSVTASKYFYDRTTGTLYVRTTGSDNPNSRYIAATFRLFYSNVPIALPHDLASGYEVQFDPTIKSNSEFGVGIDTVNQSSESIEGSGQLTLVNDQSFWLANFDKLTFDNKECSIYSYHRDLDVSEAKLLFRGRVSKKDYNPQTITFGLSDQMSELRTLVALETIGSLGLRNPTNLDLAYQRMILGKVYGHRPTNLDAVNDGYPLTGTLSAVQNSTNVGGSGTQYRLELAKDDTVIINGVKYTVASVTNNNNFVLTEPFSEADTGFITSYVLPNQPKRWINRTWSVAGHACRQPTTTTLVGSTTSKLIVTSTKDISHGDVLYVGTLGSGERATVERVININIIQLASSLGTAPLAGVTVIRPAVQNVRINDRLLVYYRDYTFDAETGILTLRRDAEANAGEVRFLPGTISVSPGSFNVPGTGLDAILKPGHRIGVEGDANFIDVLDVTETGATLTAAWPGGSLSNVQGKYKPLVMSDKDVLTCDVLGRTVDGTSTGTLIDSGPSMVRTLLEDLGLVDIVDEASFTEAESDAQEEIGLVVPAKFGDTKLPSYRDVINTISKSINGQLVQVGAFSLGYFIAQPSKDVTALRFDESDILKFDLDTTAEKMVKTVVVNYQPKEYDYITATNSIRTEQKTSDNSNYLLKTERTRTFDSKLVTERAARIYAERWTFLLETSTSTLKLETKLQGALLEVGDIIDVSHRKLFVRFGGSDNRRLFLVESVKKNGKSVSVEAVDLSNGFNRSANITDATNEYADATDDEKLYGGYLTDEYGMQDNDPETFGQNLIY